MKNIEFKEGYYRIEINEACIEYAFNELINMDLYIYGSNIKNTPNSIKNVLFKNLYFNKKAKKFKDVKFSIIQFDSILVLKKITRTEFNAGYYY